MISLQASDPATQGRAGVFVFARRVVQGLGGAVMIAFAAMMPWAEFSSAGVALGPVELPLVLLGLAGLMVTAGLGFLALSLFKLLIRLPHRTAIGVLAVGAATIFSLAGIEYGYLRTGGLSAYEYRPAARLLFYSLGIALLACSVPENLGPRIATRVQGKQIGRWQVLLMAAGVVLLGGIIGGWALDGMPHITDGTAYLLEARTLWSGQLATKPPKFLELFDRELLAFHVSQAGYFGKYPIGWPMVLGLFDALGVPWLANAVLAGLLVVLTYLTVCERGSRRLAGFAAAVVALCPWLWFNAGTMMSHLASAVCLWLFLWLLLRTRRTRSRAMALLAGLALGGAVLTRPADAAFFALPCAAYAFVCLIRQPRLWLSRLPLVAAGALPGVALYLWVSSQLGAGGSTYGGGHAAPLFQQTPHSLAHFLAWLQQSWVGLSSQWFAGAVPAAGLILCGAIFGRKQLRGQGLVFACCGSLFFCYGVFVFGGRAWVGPRWYVPLIPTGALLIAAGLESATRAVRSRSPGGVLAAGYLRVSGVAIAVVLLIAVPVRVIELAQRPPHGIDGRMVQRIEQAELTHAVVALPANGLDPRTGQPNFKRGIAGMWTMQMPIDHSEVIYIASVEGWQGMARAAWPQRSLYQMNDATGDYTLIRIHTTSPEAEAQQP